MAAGGHLEGMNRMDGTDGQLRSSPELANLRNATAIDTVNWSHASVDDPESLSSITRKWISSQGSRTMSLAWIEGTRDYDHLEGILLSASRPLLSHVTHTHLTFDSISNPCLTFRRSDDETTIHEFTFRAMNRTILDEHRTSHRAMLITLR
jgi:hypothetical protein